MNRSDVAQSNQPTGLDRRKVLRAAAWGVPVVVVATAAPAFAVSNVNVGAYHIDGKCGFLGTLFPGFRLTAGPTVPLPVGTTVTITASGGLNIGVLEVTGGVVNVSGTGSTRTYTLTQALPAGGTIDFRSTLSVSLGYTLNAAVALPSGYTATGGKATGSVSVTAIFCSAN